MGPLGDDKAVPTLKEWAAVGKPIETRQAAISAWPGCKKTTSKSHNKLRGILTEPRAPLRFSAIFALGERGDVSGDAGAGVVAKEQRFEH